jgi:hypothetical protein
MDPVRWKQVKNLYEAASARPVSDRAAFLAEACAGDTDLRREVQRLLDQPVDTGGLFELRAGASEQPFSASTGAGTSSAILSMPAVGNMACCCRATSRGGPARMPLVEIIK